MKPERIGDNLKEVPGWTTESTSEALVKTYHLFDLDDALRFVGEVAAVAVGWNHYPMITIYKNQVKLRLTSPEADGLTELDFVLAKQFDGLA